MRFFNPSFAILFLVFFHGFFKMAYSQNHDLISSFENDRVDSVYQSLTPAQRIAQLEIIDQNSWTKGDSVIRYAGGVLVRKISRRSSIDSLKALAAFPPLVLYQPENSLKFMGIEALPMEALMAVNDPQMFHGLGKALGKQCRRYGFQGILPIKEDPLKMGDVAAGWRLEEIGYGMM